jgi:hypothetical protein
VGKPGRKKHIGRPRRRWEDGMEMDLREIGWVDVECVQLVQDRGQWRVVVNAAIYLRVLEPRVNKLFILLY